MNLTVTKINFYYATDCKPCKMEAMTEGAANIQSKIQNAYSQNIEINFINGDVEGDERGEPLKISPHIVFFDSLGRVRYVVNGFPIIENVDISITELIEYVLFDAIINVDAANGPSAPEAQNLSKVQELKGDVTKVLLKALGSANVQMKEGD